MQDLPITVPAVCGRGWGLLTGPSANNQPPAIFIFDLVSEGPTGGRFAACVAAQELIVLSFRVGAWADRSSSGGMALPLPLLSAQGFQCLEMAAYWPKHPLAPS